MKILIIICFGLLLAGCKKETIIESATPSNEFKYDVNYSESTYHSSQSMNKDVKLNIYFPDSITISFSTNDSLHGQLAYFVVQKAPTIRAYPVGFGNKDHTGSKDYVSITVKTNGDYDYYYGANYEAGEGYSVGINTSFSKSLFKIYIYK